jgi:hypothetical protein
MLAGESLLIRVLSLPGGFVLVLLLPLLLAVVIVEDEPVRALRTRLEVSQRGGRTRRRGAAQRRRHSLLYSYTPPPLLLPSSKCATYGPSAPPNVRLRGLTEAPPYPSPMLTLKTLLLPEDCSGGWNEKGSSLRRRRRRWGCEFAGCGVGADAPCIRISLLPFLSSRIVPRQFVRCASSSVDGRSSSVDGGSSLFDGASSSDQS